MTNSNDEILRQLCDHLKHQSGPKVEIDPDRNLVEQLSLDSIKVLNLIMEIEDKFDITIPINALADINTVRELAELISKTKAQL